VLWQVNQSKEGHQYSTDEIIYETEPTESIEPCFIVHMENINPGFPYVNLGRYDANEKRWLATCVSSMEGMPSSVKQKFYEVEVDNVIGFLHYRQ
jgi:hypothetical protein